MLTTGPRGPGCPRGTLFRSAECGNVRGMAEQGPPIESVDRALRLRQVLGARGSGATLEEIASAVGLPKSSVHRTLAALRERRFATQQSDGRYLIGPELLRVAFDFYERMDTRVALRPVLDR